ncbi:MAG TPA: hypothetical protein VGQ16_15720 [Vicinamibacterales bacterium]|jgi:hypothetical protein|nr:hypothetical protein [Vicinamibacterales bacterium]
MSRLRVWTFLLTAVVGSPRLAGADWLLIPFIGVSGRTETGFLDLDDVVSNPHPSYGAGVTFLPDGMVGAEAEVSWTPSAFTGHDLIESSRIITATGGMVLTLPKRWSPRVRPYVMIGAGLIHVTSTDIAGIFPVDSARGVTCAGAGAWIPISPRLGARASVRYLHGGSADATNRFKMWQAAGGMTVQFR